MASDVPEIRPKTRSILFVCTGNTCRSPLAEAICKRLLAEKLGCDPQDLPQHGFQVNSAGVAATPGDAVSEPSVEMAKEYGIDLAAHCSRMVNPELLENATDIVAMTRSHAVVLMMRYSGYGPLPQLLCGPDQDLDDPIGGDLELYRHCTRTIETHLHRYLAEWLGS